jgi:NhaC family Na+:H+ antiporter
MDLSLIWGFFSLALIIFLLSPKKEIALNQAFESIKNCFSIYAVVLLLGLNVAMWMSSGLLASIIYYALNIVNPRLFLMSVFIFTGLIAYIMGTGLGTFSTIGMVFIGLSKALNVPIEMVIGAIVSGAFIADKLSPLSALTQLTLKVTDVSYKDFLIKALKTFIPSFILSIIFYYLIMPISSNHTSINLIHEQSQLKEAFNIMPLLLIVPIILIILSILGLDLKLNMTLSILILTISSLLFQKTSVQDVFSYWLWGYEHPSLDSIHGGGMINMIEVIIIVMAAVGITGMISSQGFLKPLIDKTLKNVHSPIKLVFRSSLLSIFLTSIACDQTIGIVIPGQNLKSHYQASNLPNTLLARTISDSGTIIAPLEFWNVNALIIFSLSQVSALDYGIFAVFCYLMPFMTYLISYIEYKNHNFKNIT